MSDSTALEIEPNDEKIERIHERKTLLSDTRVCVAKSPSCRPVSKLGFKEIEDKKLANVEQELHDKAEHGDCHFFFRAWSYWN